MATVAQLNVEIGARIEALQKGLRAASRELAAAGKEMGVAGKKAGQNFSNNFQQGIKEGAGGLSRIGTALTQGVTLPLALMGGAAIQAAGQMESLKLSMVATFANAGRSAADALKEVEALRKAALAPGLDFQQAVSASIRLQSVGLSAEKARNVIIELANAVASTGGTAENLSSVTVQMSQMISKGKVLSQDLRIIQENLPIISSLMLKAFGTSNAEAIQELGITGKQFIEGITKEMTKLNRVEGGISNAIVNAGSAIKQFLAGIGNELNKVFNIGEKSEQFAAFLQDLQKWFAGLSNHTKQLAVEFGLVLLAAGPLLKVFSVLGGAAAQVASGFRTAFAAIETLNAGMTAMEAAAIRVKLAFGIIGIVAALGLAIYAMSDSFDAATFASDKFSDAQKEIVSQTSKEIGAVNQLFDAAKDQSKSNFDRGQSIRQLLKLYPDYFKGMDLEGASVARLTELQNGLNGSILRGVAERKKAEAVNSIYEKQAEIITRIQQIRDGGEVTTREAGLINTGDMIRAGGIAAAVILKMQAQSEALGNQVTVVSGQFDRAFGKMAVAIDPVLQKEYELRDAYYAAKDVEGQVIKSTDTHTASKKELAKAQREHNAAMHEAAKPGKVLAEVLSDITNEASRQKLLDIDDVEAKLKVAESGLKRLLDAGWKPNTVEVMKLAGEVRQLQVELNALKPPDPIVIDIIRKEGPGPRALPTITTPTGTDSNVTSLNFDEQTKLAEEWKNTYLGITQQAVDGAAQIFSDAVDQKRDKDLAALEAEGKVRLENAKGNAALEAVIQADLAKKRADIEKKAAIKKKVIALGEAAVNIAVAITKAIASAPPPLNIPAIVATAAQGAIQLGIIAAQKFAAGTRDAPGGLALVGERGPELVNLPRHSQVFNAGVTRTAMGGGMQEIYVSGEFRAVGSDLVLVIDRERAKSARFR